MHSLSKGGLFLCAGIVEHNTHTKDIRQMGGLAATMPVTAVCFIICAFSVMCIPPTGGFFSKYMVINGAINAGRPWMALVFLFGTVLTIVYLLRLFVKVFLGEARMNNVRESSFSMLFSVVLLAGLSIAGGVFIGYPSGMVQSIVQKMAVMIR
jgi:NADH-quinone oxidoreductase subunit L